MIFTQDTVYFVTTAKKGTHFLSWEGIALIRRFRAAKHLEPLKGGRIPIEILIRGKDAEQNAKQFEKCLDTIKAAGVCELSHRVPGSLTDIVQKKVGVLSKDTSAGPFADDWKKAFGDTSKEVEEVDISTALSAAAFAVKDENELVGGLL